SPRAKRAATGPPVSLARCGNLREVPECVHESRWPRLGWLRLGWLRLGWSLRSGSSQHPSPRHTARVIRTRKQSRTARRTSRGSSSEVWQRAEGRRKASPLPPTATTSSADNRTRVRHCARALARAKRHIAEV